MQMTRCIVVQAVLIGLVAGAYAQPAPTSAPARTATTAPGASWLPADDMGNLPKPPVVSSAIWRVHCSVRGRLLAIRQAKAQATYQLGQQLRGMAVTPKLTVGDLIAASDQPEVEMKKFLLGADDAAIRYFPKSPVLAVRLEISAVAAMTSFKGWADNHLTGKNQDKLQLVIKLTETKSFRKKVLTAEGLGAVPQAFCKTAAPEERATADCIENLPVELSGPIMLWPIRTTPESVPITAPKTQPTTATSMPASAPADTKTPKPLKSLWQVLHRDIYKDYSLNDIAKQKPAFKKKLEAALPLVSYTDIILVQYDFRPLWIYLAENPDTLKGLASKPVATTQPVLTPATKPAAPKVIIVQPRTLKPATP